MNTKTIPTAIQKAVDVTQVIKMHLNKKPEEVIYELTKLPIPADIITDALFCLVNKYECDGLDLCQKLGCLLEQLRSAKGGFAWADMLEMVAGVVGEVFADGKLTITDILPMVRVWYIYKKGL